MADLFDISKYGLKKFDGKDYLLWRDKVLTAVRAVQCIDAINPDFEINDKTRNKEDRAKMILMSSIDDKILRRLRRKSASDIWDDIVVKYQDTHAQNVVFLKRNFLNSKQQINESLSDFIDRTLNLRDEIEALQHHITDIDTSMTILQGLLPSYDNFVQCLIISTTL